MTLRSKELGLFKSHLPSGKFNSITDIKDFLVGYKTICQKPNASNSSLIRSGVTVLLPRGREKNPSPVWAGFYSLNGNGEMTGTHWIKDGGYFVGPICLTNSHNIGIVHHTATKWMIKNYKKQWTENHLWAMPVVAETYDGVLSNINSQPITENDVWQAFSNAKTGKVKEGNVGGGTGMICYEFKGGTGTSSKIVKINKTKYTLATIVQANHGIRPWFTVEGKNLGKQITRNRLLNTKELDSKEKGSIVVIIATDAPMLPHQLKRLAKRAAIGIGRTGTPGGNNSGDIFLALSTNNKKKLPQIDRAVNKFEYLNDEVFDTFYEAVVQSTEESILNAMLAAKDMVSIKPKGKLISSLKPQDLK